MLRPDPRAPDAIAKNSLSATASHWSISPAFAGARNTTSNGGKARPPYPTAAIKQAPSLQRARACRLLELDCQVPRKLKQLLDQQSQFGNIGGCRCPDPPEREALSRKLR
jgi:hypothetical protein